MPKPQQRRQAAATPRNALHATIAAQQTQIRTLQAHARRQAQIGNALVKEVVALKSQMALVGKTAGLGGHFAALTKKADEMNPASPIPDPPSEAPVETTEQALAPETMDDPQNMGATPGSVEDVPADLTTSPTVPGETMPEQPFNELVDVQAPVTGTEDQLPLDQTKTETDVRVGSPDDPEPAFPLTPAFEDQPSTTGGSADSTTSGRTFASLRLARLRVQAGIADGDDITLAEKIASSNLSAQSIANEIETLGKVASRRSARPAGAVPRPARDGGGQRTMPSMAPDTVRTAAASSDVDTAVADSDLFSFGDE